MRSARGRESSLLWVPLTILTLLLTGTQLGYIPFPGVPGFLTLIHVPVILASVLCGPLLGLVLGAVWGVSNYLQFVPHDPVVQIAPRVACGLVAWLVFWMARRYGNPESQLTLGSFLAATAGSLTNTLGVGLLALVKGSLRADQLLAVVAFHALPEALMATLILIPVAVSQQHRH